MRDHFNILYNVNIFVRIYIRLNAHASCQCIDEFAICMRAWMQDARAYVCVCVCVCVFKE